MQSPAEVYTLSTACKFRITEKVNTRTQCIALFFLLEYALFKMQNIKDIAKIHGKKKKKYIYIVGYHDYYLDAVRHLFYILYPGEKFKTLMTLFSLIIAAFRSP